MLQFEEALMFKQLLVIKERRENRILREIQATKEAIALSQSEQLQLKAKVSDNLSLWSEGNNLSGVAPKGQFTKIITALYGHFYEQDHKLRWEREQKEKSELKMREQLSELGLRLKKNRAEQEKLKYIMEES